MGAAVSTAIPSHRDGDRRSHKDTTIGINSRQVEQHVSAKLFEEARRYIPGGVNSPVRAFKGVGGEPLFIERAEGAYIYATRDRKSVV